MEVSVGSCCHDFIAVMTHYRSPLAPIRARPTNLTPRQTHSDTAQAPSIRTDLCVCLEILNLCSLYFFIQTSMKMLQTHTHSDFWLMGDGWLHLMCFLCRSWCGHETSSGSAIRKWQAAGEWFKSCHLTNLLSCRRFSESKTISVASYCFICPAGLLLH